MRTLQWALLLLALSRAAIAADTPFKFEAAADEQRYEQLIAELRCLVCQNQSLADSHADLAQDLRNEVFRMVNAGKSNEDIIAYLVARYGDFVLYRPPLIGITVLLWFGPAILLAGAGIVWWRVGRGQRHKQPPDAAEAAAIAALTSKRTIDS